MTWQFRRRNFDTALNEAIVALTAGNLELATSIATEIQREKGAPRVSRVRAELVLAQVKSQQGPFTGILDQLELLFEKVPKRNSALQALVGNEIVNVCHRSGNLAIGASRGEEMLRLYGGSWPKVDVVELLCQLSSCHFLRGDTARAEEIVHRALVLAQQADSPKGRAQSLWQSAALAEVRGDLALAQDQLDQAKHWTQIAGLRKVMLALNHNAAVIMLERPDADLSSIHKLAEASYLEASSQNHPEGVAYACEILSEVALRREDHEMALIYAKKGLSELPPEIPGPKASLLVQVAKVLARMCNYEQSGVELSRACDHMEQLEPSRELAKQWGDIARVFVEIGLTDRGVYAYEKAVQMSGLMREEQDSFVS